MLRVGLKKKKKKKKRTGWVAPTGDAVAAAASPTVIARRRTRVSMRLSVVGRPAFGSRFDASPRVQLVPDHAVPIMPSTDLDASLAFYERLGFTSVGAGSHVDWNYLILRRGGVHLHFYGDPTVDPLTTSSSCYVYTDDADALYDTWSAIGVEADPKTGSRLQPPVDTSWGMREFALVDPSGNLLRIGSPSSV